MSIKCINIHTYIYSICYFISTPVQKAELHQKQIKWCSKERKTERKTDQQKREHSCSLEKESECCTPGRKAAGSAWLASALCALNGWKAAALQRPVSLTGHFQSSSPLYLPSFCFSPHFIFAPLPLQPLLAFTAAVLRTVALSHTARGPREHRKRYINPKSPTHEHKINA